MLRILLNILILMLVFRLSRRLFSFVARSIGKASGRQSVGGGAPEKSQPDYSDLTSHDIEDADYEEIRKESE